MSTTTQALSTANINNCVQARPAKSPPTPGTMRRLLANHFPEGVLSCVGERFAALHGWHREYWEAAVSTWVHTGRMRSVDVGDEEWTVLFWSRRPMPPIHLLRRVGSASPPAHCTVEMDLAAWAVLPQGAYELQTDEDDNPDHIKAPTWAQAAVRIAETLAFKGEYDAHLFEQFCAHAVVAGRSVRGFEEAVAHLSKETTPPDVLVSVACWALPTLRWARHQAEVIRCLQRVTQ